MADFRIGVVTPKASRLFELLDGSGYPDLYACEFRSKPQRELPRTIRSIRRFRQIVAEFKPDIVHVNGGADLSIVMWSHPFGGFRIVRTHHAIRRLGNDFYHRHVYSRRVAWNIYVSSTSMGIAHASGLTPQPSTAITNGVDLDRFRPSLPKDPAIAAQLNLQNDMFVFGSCAGVADYKRVDLVIEAASKLRISRPYLILAIGDPEEDGHRLEEYARQRGVTQFRYCGFHGDVRGFVSLLNVGFVLSDSIETISLGSREMLAMGKPLISSSFAGLKENIVDGHNGFLIRPGQVDDVAAAMRRFLTMSPDELLRLSANARSFAEENFTLETQLQETLAVYEKVLNRNQLSSSASDRRRG